MRPSLVLGFLPLLLVASGSEPKQDQKVTYSTVAKTADVVLAEIAANTGLTIETTADAKNHVLIVSVTDVAPKDLLERIAKVMSSRATLKDGAWSIVPDQPARNRERAAVVADRIKEFREAQEAIRKELDRKPSTDPEDEDYSIFDEPGSKALAQLVLMIGPNEVGTLGLGGRIVFSTTPNAMQRPMRGSQVAAVFQALFRDHNAYVDEQQKSGLDLGVSEELRAYESLFGGRPSPRKFEAVPSKAVLAIGSKADGFTMIGGTQTAELKVYDAKGQTVVASQLTLDSDYRYSDSTEEPEPDDPPQQKPDEADAKPIELSEKSKTLMAIMPGDELDFNVTPELRAYLFDPVTHDPLSFINSDAIIAIAKQKGLDVVANLPDSVLLDSSGFFFGDEGGQTVGTVVAELNASDHLATTTEHGWMVVMPKEPVSARENRQDRAALKSLIASIEKDGSVSLDSLANFAMVSPSPMQSGATLPYFMVFAPEALMGAFNDQMSWDMLRLYGNLPPETRRNLRDGQRVPFSVLSPAARNVLAGMAFGADANIVPAKRLTAPKQTLPWFLLSMAGSMGGGQQSFIEEPTEVMPNGLPDGFVELTSLQGPVLKQTSQHRNLFMALGSMGPEELAFLEIMREQSPEFDMGFVGGADSAKMAQRETLNFRFWLSEGAGLDKTLFDEHLDKDAQEVSLTNLPADFRALIQKAKEEILKSPFGKLIKSGFGG